jgi:hypothetical protein
MVVPTMLPPVILTLAALCVANVPNPSVVRCAAASASSIRARPAAVQITSSMAPAPAVLRPRSRSVVLTLASLLNAMAAEALMSSLRMVPSRNHRARD